MKITNEKEYRKAIKELKGWKDSFKKMKKELPKNEFNVYLEVQSCLVQDLKEAMTQYKKQRKRKRNQKGLALPIIFAIIYGVTLLTKVLYPTVLEHEQKQQSKQIQTSTTTVTNE